MKCKSALKLFSVLLLCSAWFAIFGAFYITQPITQAAILADPGQWQATTMEPSSLKTQITFTPVATIYLPIMVKPPLPTGVHILDNHSSYTHSLDYGYTVVGEVWNNTNNYLDRIKVVVKFYSNNQLIDTDTDSLTIDLVPGQKSCFEVRTFLGEKNWDYYEFDTLSYVIEDLPAPEIILVNSNGYLSSSSKRYSILGEVRNDYIATIRNIKVQGTVYSANNIVIDCWWQYANVDTLQPEQTSSFELNFTYRDIGYDDVVDYKVDVQPFYWE